MHWHNFNQWGTWFDQFQPVCQSPYIVMLNIRVREHGQYRVIWGLKGLHGVWFIWRFIEYKICISDLFNGLIENILQHILLKDWYLVKYMLKLWFHENIFCNCSLKFDLIYLLTDIKLRKKFLPLNVIFKDFP